MNNPYSTYTAPGGIITGIDIPFWDLVWLLVKVTIAWIPAMVILIVFYVLAIAALGALGLGLGVFG